MPQKGRMEKKMNQDLVVEGNISVKAAILANRREIHEILVDENKSDKDTRYILAKAYERGIPVLKRSREDIDKVAEGKTHGGLIARVGERVYQSIEDLLKSDNPFIAIIEGVEDPFNFGYICRSLYAAGCHGILVGERNWSSAAKTVTKSSAGASEYINMVTVTDFDLTLKKLKKKGIRILCAMREDAVSCYEVDYEGPVCLAIGGEMRGLSKSILAHSDQNIYIPYEFDFRNALNGAAATAVLAFECLRQRQK